ncbi:unnamed protein product [Microthlaspi erraticum]|uniref:RNase H type-1 domain-containing protein n=1 Tax=Microthlaspi erraticum TaxID=1685480 RepID=A0A6D2JSW7_9BRAS|nr:unnamed protein product [Microthlaspi erraticum]
MPVYAMNVFKLPVGICEEINGVLAKFWWNNNEDRKGMHWFAWKRLCLSKKEGGLGFRDIESFNLALLGKQAWRLLQKPECLMARVIRGRYYSDGNILTARVKKKSSFIWKSILQGRDLMKKGMRFVIGDGSIVSAWIDPWLPTHPPRAPIPRTTRICSRATYDMVGWHYNKNGIYSVKSAYWLATHLPEFQVIESPSSNMVLNKAIWKISTAPKIKHFIWKIISGSLSTKETLKRRHIIRDSTCLRCCQQEETASHLLFECPYAQQVWRGSGLAVLNLADPMIPLEEKLETLFLDRALTSFEKNFQTVLWLLWRLWKSRNSLVFQRRSIHWRSLIRYVNRDVMEFLNTQELMQGIFPIGNGGSRPNRTPEGKWRPPPTGWVKCNYDGAFHNRDVSSNAGWIIRDENGTYKGSGHATDNKPNSALEGELQALIIAMQQAWIKGHRKVIFEGDCKEVIDLVNRVTLNFGVYNWIREIWFTLNFEE